MHPSTADLIALAEIRRTRGPFPLASRPSEDPARPPPSDDDGAPPAFAWPGEHPLAAELILAGSMGGMALGGLAMLVHGFFTTLVLCALLFGGAGFLVGRGWR